MTLEDVPSGSSEPSETLKEKNSKEPEMVCSATDHYDQFNPTAYLESFYCSATEDPAMQVVLFFLPGILYRLPAKITTVLDLGAGPTVYLPIALRHRAAKIYTSDYAPANRDTLQAWAEKRTSFNWIEVCKWLASIEASMDNPEKMQQDTRDKMQAILEVNVQANPVVQGVHWKTNDTVEIPRKFQVVATVFCLEYSCETLAGYMNAVKSACSLIEDGGYLVQGGVLEAESYEFDGKKFKCHFLKKSHILEALKANGFAHEEKSEGLKLIEREEIFLLVSKKLH